MRIVVDRGKCTGLGMCEAHAPTLFEIGLDGSLQVLTDAPSGDEREELEAAVEACPTGALSIAAADPS